MKAYKCDICGALFAKNLSPTLMNGLIVECTRGSLNRPADLCAGCLEMLRDTTHKLLSTEENDEPETSSSEC